MGRAGCPVPLEVTVSTRYRQRRHRHRQRGHRQRQRGHGQRGHRQRGTLAGPGLEVSPYVHPLEMLQERFVEEDGVKIASKRKGRRKKKSKVCALSQEDLLRHFAVLDILLVISIIIKYFNII